jgi:hypothetical protein
LTNQQTSEDTTVNVNAKANHPKSHDSIEDGLDFILSHFPPTILWPRTISTHTTEGRQVLVYSEEEALARFKQASLLDCKISAYPHYVEWKGLNRQAPDIIFIDLDYAKLKSKLGLERALNGTLHNIRDRPGGFPTVIWSGHGYHIYLPVKAFVLEEENEFAKFEQSSRRFIQFAEQYLSNNKSDPCHAFTMSFKNCMLRIPGSYNSKSQPVEEIKVIQKWDGNRHSIKPLLFDFYIYLQDTRLKKIRKHYHPGRESCPYWRSSKNDR